MDAAMLMNCVINRKRYQNMRALSLFANIGVAEAYLDKIGVEVVLANELVKRRAELYSEIYPKTEMICGDITEKNIYEKIKNKAIKDNIDVIIATPPCQGFSRACRKQNENDSRNLLIMPVISLVKEIKPRYVFMENVPQLLETEVTIDGKKTLIQDYMMADLGHQYVVSVHQINTENYGIKLSESDIQHVIRVFNVFAKTISIREDLDVCLDEYGII
jgi:DNA (cytosine-5)-methyltransferase 1